MSDKNRTSEEDYLDSLLRSITGESDSESGAGSIDDVLLKDEMDFDNEVNTGGSDEEFLSDFEKEFFGSSEADSLTKENGMEGISDITDISDVEPQNVQSEAQESLEIPDDELFDIDSDILGAIDDVVSGDEPAQVNPIAEEKAYVDEAISKEDSSVEEDLQGLYGILGMEGEENGLPDNIEEKPKKKKKGLFSFKNKKKKNKKSGDDTVSDDLQMEDNAGVSDIDTLALDDNIGLDAGNDFSFAIDELGEKSGGEQDFGLGLDDSIFDSMDENTRLIHQMDSGEIDEEELLSDDEESKDKKKGKKGKKEKKEKKEKKKKEKSPSKKKQKKAPKEKKEKKPKEPDEIIHIPIMFIIFAISFVIVVVVAAKIGGDYYYYNKQFYEAISLYVYGNELDEGETLDQDKYETKFSKAYSLLNGLEMKEDDHQAFFDQLETIMLMDRHYEAYKGYMLIEDFDHGLDSLIKAVGMYDKYQNQARELDCFDEMTVVLSWVNEKLSDTYGLTESQARELSMLDDDEYAMKVRAIAAEARAEYEKNKIDEE